MEEHPIRLRSSDDLKRSRLTVFFRLLLAIPHLIVLTLFAVLALLAGVANWFATLFMGRSPDGLHDLLARFMRYLTHFSAYFYLLADPFPPFGGGSPYRVDLEVETPERQNRWTVAFRMILAIPASILASVLGYVAQALAFLGWFAALALGRMPEGMQNLGLYCLRYQMQTYGYVFLLTQRYPSLSSDPGAQPASA
ncbi:MAG: DUF4389 domain-containing protein [Actinobacteria bacterium]|nr:DUF4389 domain-containing protein [Actinomycetota bacterium]